VVEKAGELGAKETRGFRALGLCTHACWSENWADPLRTNGEVTADESRGFVGSDMPAILEKVGGLAADKGEATEHW
jgi:hypothetical protein